MGCIKLGPVSDWCDLQRDRVCTRRVQEQERQDRQDKNRPFSREEQPREEREDQSREEMQLRGVMLWFNPAKQHGFIRTEEGERLLVEVSGFAPGHLLGDLCAGTTVEFEREAAEVEEGFRAVGVRVVDYDSGRRARSRRRGG